MPLRGGDRSPPYGYTVEYLADEAESGNTDEKKLKVRDAFVEQPCIVSASAPVGKVAKMMAERHIGSAIVTKNDKLVGIFTVTDACRALAQVLGENEEESERVA